MKDFTYDEIFTKQLIINDEIITSLDIENEIKKHIKNIDIKIKGEEDITGNYLYVYGDFEYAHCRIKLNKIFLINEYKHYLKSIAYYIKDLITNEFFIRR